MNLFTFDGIGKFFVAECWVPLADLENVRNSLEVGVVRSKKRIASKRIPRKRMAGPYVPCWTSCTRTKLLRPTIEPTSSRKSSRGSSTPTALLLTWKWIRVINKGQQYSSLAPYTIISFPFLFSCMFGDLGHGLLMFLAGLYLVLRETNLQRRQIRDEVANFFF